jgi:maleylacetate reductase
VSERETTAGAGTVRSAADVEATDESGTFVYANPGVVHWGPDCVARGLTETVDKLGARRVFLVTTRSVAANPALAGALQRQLGDRLAGTFGAISEHAPARVVSEAARAAREAQADALVSLGGGSPIDAAKAIALALATGIDVADPDALSRSQGLSLAGQKVVPHVAIPTTLSAAEQASGFGFTAEGSRDKVGMRVPDLLPNVVFYDAQLATHTPRQLWLATGIRAVDHAIESILLPGNHPFTDTLSLEALRRLRMGLLASHRDSADLAARTQCQLGAWFSMSMPGPTAGGLSHTLSKRLGSRHGIPHGVTSCLVLPHVMRYLAPGNAARLARIADALGVDTGNLGEADSAARAADAVADLIAHLELPHHLGDFGLSDADLVEAVRPVASDAHPADDLLEVLRAAR